MMMMLLANSTSNSPSRRFQRSETSIAISERLASGRELLIRQQHHDVVTRRARARSDCARQERNLQRYSRSLGSAGEQMIKLRLLAIEARPRDGYRQIQTG